MIASSEKIVSVLFENETEFDPYAEAPPVSTLEEVFFTGYIDGAQITMQEAMDFLTSGKPPRDIEEQLIIGSTVIAVSAAVAAYLLLKPGNATVKLLEIPKPELPLPEVSSIENKTVDTLDSIIQKVIDVESYLRNLHKGQKPSPAKVAEAIKMGINLPQGKTIVDGYSYSKCVA